jgi:copper homeostasis protein (lipoprotein)
MLKRTFYLPLVFATTAILVSACSPEPASNAQQASASVVPAMSSNSRNALDWAGTYQGVLPCASCEGIKTTLTLTADGQYQLQSIYLGEEPENQFDESGSFSWDDSGGKIRLNSGTNETRWFRVEENALRQLDLDAELITGELAEHYQLAKVSTEVAANTAPDPVVTDLVDRDWQLIELAGQAVAVDSGVTIHFSADGKVWGRAGCNRFSGSWQPAAYRLTLGQLAVTMMACSEEKMQLEQAVLAQLALADNYSLADGELSLNKARMAPLARFKLKVETE